MAGEDQSEARGFPMIMMTGSTDEEADIMNKIERIGEILQAYDFDITDEIKLKNYRSKLIDKL